MYCLCPNRSLNVLMFARFIIYVSLCVILTPLSLLSPWDILSWLSLYHFVLYGHIVCLKRHLQINVLSLLLSSLLLLLFLVVLLSLLLSSLSPLLLLQCILLHNPLLSPSLLRSPYLSIPSRSSAALLSLCCLSLSLTF